METWRSNIPDWIFSSILFSFFFSKIEFSSLWLLRSDAVYSWSSATDVTFDNLLGRPLQIQYCLFLALFCVCVSPQEKHSSFIREARKANKKKKKSIKATWDEAFKTEHILFNFMSALLIKFNGGIMGLKKQHEAKYKI